MASPPVTVMNGGYDGGVGRGGVGVTSVDARQSTDKLFVRTHEQKKKKNSGGGRESVGFTQNYDHGKIC